MNDYPVLIISPRIKIFTDKNELVEVLKAPYVFLPNSYDPRRCSANRNMRRLHGACARVKNIAQAHAYVVRLFEQKKIRADVGEVSLHIRSIRERRMAFVYGCTGRRHIRSDVFRIHHVTTCFFFFFNKIQRPFSLP